MTMGHYILAYSNPENITEKKKIPTYGLEYVGVFFYLGLCCCSAKAFGGAST